MSTYPSNPILDRLPAHLKQYIKPQNYKLYTPTDQAVWQYVMRSNIEYLQKYAHESYLEGLKLTGISVDTIPSMYGMNRILKKIGWAAAAVDGLIPSAAFMEFQAYNVLVIASEIRQIDHIEYTPTPDIIHESAGHAPILANPEYAEYLRRFGHIGARAITSRFDKDIFQAVRQLSILKEKRNSKKEEIDQAESIVVALQEEHRELSEMTKVRNLHWWTVEYGLIGSDNDYRIYGAGLLSSIGESHWCMSDKVAKLPYSIDAAYQNFDVTKAQPQLFVTPNFAYLSKVVEELAETMAMRHGGLKGIKKLIDSEQLGTIELSTGIQVSGIFTDVIVDPVNPNKIAYFRTRGATALAHRDKELILHSRDHHPEGFGSPIGKLKGINLAIEDMSPTDLEAYKIYEGFKTKLVFESGVSIEGKVLSGRRSIQGKIILIEFVDCLVKFKEQILFEPHWGHYHMAVGKELISAYAGPADDGSFDLITHRVENDDAKPKWTELDAFLDQIRETSLLESVSFRQYEKLWRKLQGMKTPSWLAFLKWVELLQEGQIQGFEKEMRIRVEYHRIHDQEHFHLLEQGLERLHFQLQLLN